MQVSGVCNGQDDRSEDLGEYVARLAARDRDALGLLYDRTRRLVYSLALRILGRSEDAEDVTVETYTQVWRDAGCYDSRRGSVEAWLITIARTRAIDRLRLRAARPDMRPGEQSIADADGRPEASIDSRALWETRDCAVRILRTLAPAERRPWITFRHRRERHGQHHASQEPRGRAVGLHFVGRGDRCFHGDACWQFSSSSS